MNRKVKIKNAFTLAEVLITLGVIGVVAAVTMPTLITNVQERVRKEQVRTVKYKLTKATDKMNSLGKIGHYDSTEAFVNELKKHLSIAKVCDSNHLAECWGGTSFTNANGSKTYTVSSLTTGKSLEALQFNSGKTDTVGIVTGDGTPIILTYGKECQALDETKQYTWSVVDGKPETNATAGCVSMVFDINGAKGPNKVGTDVRTMNSLLGMVYLGNTYPALTQAECTKYKNDLGINNCYNGADGGSNQQQDNDKWAGAVKACHDIGLHLPSMETLSQIATLQFGVPIDVYEDVDFLADCSTYTGSWHCKTPPSSEEYSSPVSNFSGLYWSSREGSAATAYRRSFYSSGSYYSNNYRYNGNYAVCLGDEKCFRLKKKKRLTEIFLPTAFLFNVNRHIPRRQKTLKFPSPRGSGFPDGRSDSESG